MKNTLLNAIIIGLLAGLTIGVILNSIPFVDKLIPDEYNGSISGVFIGAVISTLLVKSKNDKD